MAKMQIEGPYRIQTNEQEEWEIMEIVGDQYMQLRPRLRYAKEKRTSAYRRLALMNRRWQKVNKVSNEMA